MSLDFVILKIPPKKTTISPAEHALAILVTVFVLALVFGAIRPSFGASAVLAV
jgi:hypothetical protein